MIKVNDRLAEGKNRNAPVEIRGQNAKNLHNGHRKCVTDKTRRMEIRITKDGGGGELHDTKQKRIKTKT
jgi:hypothetical protein